MATSFQNAVSGIRAYGPSISKALPFGLTSSAEALTPVTGPLSSVLPNTAQALVTDIDALLQQQTIQSYVVKGALAGLGAVGVKQVIKDLTGLDLSTTSSAASTSERTNPYTQHLTTSKDKIGPIAWLPSGQLMQPSNKKSVHYANTHKTSHRRAHARHHRRKIS